MFKGYLSDTVMGTECLVKMVTEKYSYAAELDELKLRMQRNTCGSDMAVGGFHETRQRKNHIT